MARCETVPLGLQAGGATSSGPAAGTGLEMILQGFNWESYKNDWYKVSSCSMLTFLPRTCVGKTCLSSQVRLKLRLCSGSAQGTI